MLDLQLIDAIYKADVRASKRFLVTKGSSHLRALWGLRQVAEYCAAVRENRPMRVLPELVPRGGHILKVQDGKIVRRYKE